MALPFDLKALDRPDAGIPCFDGRHGSKRTKVVFADERLGAFPHCRKIQGIRNMECTARHKRRTTGMIPNAVFIDFGTNTITGMEIRGNFFDFFDHDGRRQKRVEAFLDLPQLVNARGPEIHDLPRGMNAGISAPARGRNLHLAGKKNGEGFFEGFLDGRLSGLLLEPEKHRAIVFENKFDVSHR